MWYNKAVEELYQLLFEKGRVGKVLEALRKQGLPAPSAIPQRAVLYGHALCLYGDYQQALKVYSSIPPDTPHESERLWGLATAHLRLGNLKQVKPLLDEAFENNPPSWLSPRIYNTYVNLYIYEGRFEQASTAIVKGIEEALAGGHLTEQLILEGNRGVIEIYQGNFEGGTSSIQRSVNQLLVRDCILSAANFLINLSGSYENLGVTAEGKKCLGRAERLLEESGAKGRLVFLKQTQGELLEREGDLVRAEETFREALALLQELPNPKLEAQVTCDLAHLRFEKGDSGSALSLVRKAREQVSARGYHILEDLCLAYEGKFLLHAGATQEGIALLNESYRRAEALGKREILSYIALYLALGYRDLKRSGEAEQWLRKSLELAGQCHMISALLVEKEVLTSLLLEYGEGLPPTDYLSQLVVQLHHPAFLKRLLRHSPEGKVLFIRSLKVHDARRFQPELARLKNDPHKEVRRTARLLLNGWHLHAAYRVYTFGTLRVFLEGKMFSDKDWIRPGVKRLFLFLATRPEEWHPTESLLETFWDKPHPEKTPSVLRYLFSSLRKALEPWSRLAGDYVFFQSQRGAYGFFPGERFWMDWQVFEEEFKKAEKANLARNFKEARKAYREALGLYLGDYLEEFPYEDWLNPKRDHLRELYFRGVMRYATLERDSGNLPEARRVLEEALFKDLSRSGCVVLLIQILSEMKLTQEAREWGQRHLKYLKEELKEKPAPEVVEVLNRIKD
jgi:tetratricopeptide (TPR) repeat protein